MKIFGKELTKADVLKRIGDISQLGFIKTYEFADGVSRGLRAVDIKSPCGLDMTILLDRAMDISYLSYKSVPIGWRSATRETSPCYYESSGLEWLRTFYGGLLTTCGLTYMGAPGTDDGEELGLHGRISNIAAERVWADGKWEDDRFMMWVSGKVREAKVFGDKLELERKITTWMDEPRIVIEDVVENIGFAESPLMILYHINIGYPVLDATSKLLSSKSKVTPRDEEAKKGLDKYAFFSEPVKDFKEQVYFHDIEADSDGNANIALVNEKFNDGDGIGVWIRYSKNTLPHLIQWKQMGEGEYVCGLEPANSLVRGRKIERQEGNLKFIKPGEKVNFKVEINILTSNKEIRSFESKYC